MVWLSRKPVSSFLNRSTAVQTRQYGECSTLWINWEGTLVSVNRKRVSSSFLSRCATVQTRQYGECSTLWINWKVLCGLG